MKPWKSPEPKGYPPWPHRESQGSSHSRLWSLLPFSPCSPRQTYIPAPKTTIPIGIGPPFPGIEPSVPLGTVRGEVGNRSARLTFRIWPSKGRGQIPQSKAVSAAQPLTTPRLVRKSSTDEHRSHTSICYYHHLNKDRLLLPPYIYTGPGPLKYLLLPPPRRGLQLYKDRYNWSPLNNYTGPGPLKYLLLPPPRCYPTRPDPGQISLMYLLLLLVSFPPLNNMLKFGG